MIDLVELKSAIKKGEFVVYEKRGVIYIKDALTEECIMLLDRNSKSSSDSREELGVT